MFIRKNVVNCSNSENRSVASEIDLENIMTNLNLNETMATSKKNRVVRKHDVRNAHRSEIPKYQELKTDPKKALGLK